LIEARVKKIFKGSNFELRAEISDEGSICLTGPNGSGKSTLLGIIAGTVEADEGHVKLNSRDITELAIERRRIVLVTPDSFIPNMRLERHLVWGARNKGVKVDPLYLHRVRSRTLASVPNEIVGKLSLGNREKVALTTALLTKPEAILVDEAFSNLDNHDEFIQSYHELTAEAKIDLIFSTQQKNDAAFADHQYAMEQGSSKKLF
jgi:molybdate/tungstate transport system ATP-binding protein